MNLRKLFFRRPATDEQRTVEPSPAHVPVAATNNVVELHPTTERSNGSGSPLETTESPPQPRPKGLMDADEIVSFLGESYFNWGRHNGQNGGTAAALSHGRESIIARFQNTLSMLVERRIATIHKLESQILDIEGVSPAMTQRLKLACEHQQRDIGVLKEQSTLAAEGKGWVLEALNQYQSGFVRGLSAACDLESLGV
jgi:hypothetical protein